VAPEPTLVLEGNTFKLLHSSRLRPYSQISDAAVNALIPGGHEFVVDDFFSDDAVRHHGRNLVDVLVVVDFNLVLPSTLENFFTLSSFS
jgi:hypothetical protein